MYSYPSKILQRIGGMSSKNILILYQIKPCEINLITIILIIKGYSILIYQLS